ncbi:MAG: hypothetical protein EOM26_00335 [Alphaproteobacteria bacterium]|nr:hypothetical protein [Alphaproteobacteria bacterium]
MIFFRCEASNAIGFGHLKRCAILAKALNQVGEAVSFLVPEGGERMQAFLADQALPVITLPALSSLAEEVSYYPGEGRAIVLDLFHALNRDRPEALSRYLKQLDRAGWQVVFIDGMFGEAFRQEDSPCLAVCVQPYVGAELDTWPKSRYWIRGGAYAVMDTVYKNRPSRRIREKAENVLITFGGADPQGLTPFVMRAFSGRVDFHFRVIVGPFFSDAHRQEIASIAGTAPGRYELCSGVTDLVPHYDWADIALGGSGLSRYEFAACGLPSIFTSIYAEHMVSSDIFAEKGTGVHLGLYSELDAGAWRNALCELALSYGELSEMSRRGQALIDGCGAERLAGEIFRIFNGTQIH